MAALTTPHAEQSVKGMGFEIIGHTADVAVEATGDDLGALFANMAEGLAACMLDEQPPPAGETFDLTLAAEDVEALLFDYLDRLIVLRDIENVLPVDNAADVSIDEAGASLRASARGVPLELIAAREIKAVTYSEMCVERTNGTWRAYVVFDV